MSNEINPPTESETSTLSEQAIVFLLASIGANHINKSYDNRYKPLSDRFVALDLIIMSNMWESLEDHVKLRIINKNHDKFKSWINSHSTTEVGESV